jgi:hypothetical protein
MSPGAFGPVLILSCCPRLATLPVQLNGEWKEAALDRLFLRSKQLDLLGDVELAVEAFEKFSTRADKAVTLGVAPTIPAATLRYSKRRALPSSGGHNADEFHHRPVYDSRPCTRHGWH